MKMVEPKTLFLILVMLFMLGCDMQQDSIATYIDIYKGTDGLKMKFLENAPPKEVYSNEMFHSVVEIENMGAFDIGNIGRNKHGYEAYLALVVEEDYMEILDEVWRSSYPLRLEGKSRFNPKGRKDTITARLKAKEIDPQSETHTSAITMIACYRYKTELSTEVCVDTDPYSLKEKEKACEVRDKILSSQGAPVAITKVETKMLPHEDEKRVKPSFMIYIDNKGNGEVLESDWVKDACSSVPLPNEAFNTIYVKASLSGEALSCSPGEDRAGYVRLKGKEDFVRCTLTGGISKDKGTYTTPLAVELDYGYTTSISRDVKILKEMEY